MKHLFNYLIIFISSFAFLAAEKPCLEESAYVEGYFSAKLEDRFPNEKVEFEVERNVITVYTFPADVEVRNNIETYLKSFSDYEVVFDSCYVPSPDKINYSDICEEDVKEGDWLPELNSFFPTMLAQPHIVGYSAGYRSYDKVFKLAVLPVSIGDQFSLYQFKLDNNYGRLLFGIEACVWAIFEARAKSLSLINADYYVALPFTYINNNFSMRLRVYHESSHLGDEFLLEHTRIQRLNPSMEVADLFLSYEFNNSLTPFFGYAHVLRSDESFKVKPNSVYYGFNYFLTIFKIKVCNLEASPYIATYFTNEENHNWKLDSSVAFGYQWNKSYGHKLRIYVEGHDGFSAEGQFAKERTRYVALKLFYGY